MLKLLAQGERMFLLRRAMDVSKTSPSSAAELCSLDCCLLSEPQLPSGFRRAEITALSMWSLRLWLLDLLSCLPTYHVYSLFFLSYFFFFFFFFCFLGLYQQHMEVPRPGIETELQLPAYTTAIAMQDLSHICDLHHSSWQYLNLQSETRDRTGILMDTHQAHNPLSHQGNCPCGPLNLLLPEYHDFGSIKHLLNLTRQVTIMQNSFTEKPFTNPDNSSKRQKPEFQKPRLTHPKCLLLRTCPEILRHVKDPLWRDQVSQKVEATPTKD